MLYSRYHKSRYFCATCHDVSNAVLANLDYANMQRGRWPYGRGNHYLFDLNRDWMAGVHPETRGRWRAVAEFHPQLFVDAHEMGSLDTYLFSPARAPFHPGQAGVAGEQAGGAGARGCAGTP